MAEPTKAPEGIDQAVFTTGETIYSSYCVTCHGKVGEGLAGAMPPLDGSEWVIADDPSTIIRMQLRGLQGPIEVKGQVYDAAMPPSPHYSDEELSGVFTYIRNAWSNSAAAVTPAQIKTIRDEGGVGMLNAAELERPKPPAAKGQPSQAGGNKTTATTAEPAKSYDPIEYESSSAMTWPLTAGIIALIVSVIVMFLGKGK